MIDSEEENENDDQNTPPSKKRRIKKSKRQQRFCEKWLSDSRMKFWLQKIPDQPFEAKCKLCSVPMTADISVLMTHRETGKHRAKEAPLLTNANKITNFVKPQAQCNPLETATKRAEIKLVGMVVEHNLAYRVLDHMTDTLKDTFPDSAIAQNMALKRTKGTAIAKNVIGEEEKSILVKKLKQKKFSILTDESTDISNTKTSCILVRFYDEERGKIVSKFWDLSQVFASDGSVTAATTEHLYNCLKKSFEERSIPMENLVGFGSDGCNVRMGQNNSVATRLKRDYPGISIFKCISHSLHLVASEACEKLSQRPEELARNIYSFFNASSKRLSGYIQFQKFADIPIHSLLHPSQTRWLSLSQVVERLLEQWPALQLFFSEQRLDLKLISADSIFTSLHDPSVKLYFLFLKWALPKFTEANKYFQATKVIITDLHDTMINLYRELLLSYMSRDYVCSTSLGAIDPRDTSKFLPKSQMYLGVYVMTALQKEVFSKRRDIVDYFHGKCQEFLIQACLGLKKRYYFDDPSLKDIRVFKPKAALSQSTREYMPSLVNFLAKLPRISTGYDLQKIDDKWRKLPMYGIDEEMKKLDVDEFWSQLMNLRNDGEVHLFYNVARVVLDILSLPHSNADSERTFSKINLMKDKLRNKLTVPTVRGTLLASQNVQSSGGCTKFSPSKAMMTRMTSTNLYGEKAKRAESEAASGTVQISGESDESADEGLSI